ncbi:MAG: hypothetical protein U0T73_11235 [Chitinophagales bacterium]
MGRVFWIIGLSTLLGCRMESNELADREKNGDFMSGITDGQYRIDLKTAEELRSMQNTVENFTLLNKKKFEHVEAYQEFGELLQLQMARILENGNLRGNCRSVLESELRIIQQELPVFAGKDTARSKQALIRVNKTMAVMDSTFKFLNQ